MSHWIGVCRLVYNLALEQRNIWWRQHKRVTNKNINFATQGKEITALRAEFDWIRDVPCNALHRAIRDLDQAFSAFYSGRAKYPKFRKRGVNDSVRLQASDIGTKRLNANWSAVRLPKIGWVKFRDSRPIGGRIKEATISLDASGWNVSFLCEVEHQAPEPSAETVGIDRGVTTALALSTGELIAMPSSLDLLEARKRKLQQAAAKRKNGSNRKRKIQSRIARLQMRQARIRRDFHHRASRSIADRFGVAVLEDLKTRSMTMSARRTVAQPGVKVRQKAGLNRAILNAGWHRFATMLTYKMEERGGQVVTVPAEYTSQTCAACGVIDAQSRKSQARFACVSCGHTAHADINAAINIERRWSTPLLDVEGLHQRPREASTERSLSGFDKPMPLVA